MNRSKRVALGGLISSLSITLMLFTGIIPFGTFALPAFAGILIVALQIEYNTKIALITYLSVSFLSFLITPDREASLSFIAFLGYYPILKPYIESKLKKYASLFAKLALFNSIIFFVYTLMIYLFRIDIITDILGEYNNIAIVVLLFLANFTFLVYDRAISTLIMLYYIKIKKDLGVIKNNSKQRGN